MHKLFFASLVCLLVGCGDRKIGTFTPDAEPDVGVPPSDDAGVEPDNGFVIPPDATVVYPKVWTDYWVLGQGAAQTTIYLYAREGAKVTFKGTNQSPFTVTVPPNEFASYKVDKLGFDADPLKWYFLEATADDNFMMSGIREVAIPSYTTLYGDKLQAKPGYGLSKTHYVPWAESSPSDDQLILYAPSTTSVKVDAFGTDGQTFSKTVSVTGLYESGALQNWFSPGLNTGYSLRITSTDPIAAAAFDEQPMNAQSSGGSGYYFAGPRQSELYDDYMHLHFEQGRAYQSSYSPAAATLDFYTNNSTHVGTKVSPGTLSEMIQHIDVGFTLTFPYLAEVKSASLFGDSYLTPVKTDVRAWAAYMGYDSSQAQLEIYASQNANIKIIDGRNGTAVKMITVAKGTIYSAKVDTLGFTAGDPFLAAVSSDVPIFQEVRMPTARTDFLRQYPGEIGPPLPN